jgi:hypothetical protein
MGSMWFSLIGKGSMSPSASSMITMWDARTGQDIWKDSSAQGEEVKNDEKIFMGMAEDAKVNALSKAAVIDSLKVAFERLKPKSM